MGSCVRCTSTSTDVGWPSNCKIPAGSQSGKKLRLKNRGLKSASQGALNGDQIVNLQIVAPTSGDEKEDKHYYEEMEKRFDFDPRQKLKANYTR